MDERQQSRLLASVFSLTLEGIEDNLVLAAANNCLSFSAKLPKENKAYPVFLELSLIKETGEPYDREALLSALSFEVNRRFEAGAFK